MTYKKFNGSKDRSIALLDVRYLSWLAHGSKVNRYQTANVIARALDGAGMPSMVLRSYWYCDRDDGQTLDDQTQRFVASYEADGGAALIAAMSADIVALAHRGACDTLLIGSDDDRIGPAIEEAKLCGLRVCVLGDESMSDLGLLAEEDSALARLMRQADRRIWINPNALGSSGAAHQDGADAWPRVNEMVRVWWSERDPEEAEQLQVTLRGAHGLPQDLDRLMLARARAALGRTLDISEKRRLRTMVRDVVLGQDAEAVIPSRHEDEHEPD
ncbi:MAG: hypothetical protein RL357_1440 [Pseudomonadota bacterium]|jgi:hypothetical protein